MAIKGLDHATAFAAAEEFPINPTLKQKRTKEKHISALTNILRVSQLHYWLGIRCYFLSILLAFWVAVKNSIATLALSIFMVCWMFISDHQFSAPGAILRLIGTRKKVKERAADPGNHRTSKNGS